MSEILERKARGARTVLICFALCVAFAFLFTPLAAAQSVARFSLESVVSADEFAGESASNRPQFVDRKSVV